MFVLSYLVCSFVVPAFACASSVMRKTHGVLGNLLGTTYQQNDLGSQQGTDRAALENHVSDPRLTRFQPSTAVMARNLSSVRFVSRVVLLNR